MTKNRWKIILTLYEVAPDGLSGVDITRREGIPSGSLYPALRELRNGPLLQAEWEVPEDVNTDAKPLRIYKLTPDGVEMAKAKLDGRAESAAGWRQLLAPLSVSSTKTGWR